MRSSGPRGITMLKTCGHTFCFSCLSTFIQNARQSRRNRRRNLKCMLCRAPFTQSEVLPLKMNLNPIVQAIEHLEKSIEGHANIKEENINFKMQNDSLKARMVELKMKTERNHNI
ncbi:hypothetical protein LIER_40852 [Lithospermum erythrorhizon]|uniref:Zinc finger RING-type eukaryotic domain-containing protein n=1 Tax=Lithospermum erythrorhizon TaxID=34254 RepID=A0AAV3R4C9_LITER